MKDCVYCPKCDRSIPKGEVEEKSLMLIKKFGIRSLEEGKCPVCGTDMIDMDDVAELREERRK